jgi:hypothetical protein
VLNCRIENDQHLGMRVRVVELSNPLTIRIGVVRSAVKFLACGGKKIALFASRYSENMPDRAKRTETNWISRHGIVFAAVGIFRISLLAPMGFVADQVSRLLQNSFQFGHVNLPVVGSYSLRYRKE